MDGTCAFSCDKNKRERETHQANYGDMPSGDITKIKVENIPPFDVLYGEFLCQSFSIGSKQKGFKDRRGGTESYCVNGRVRRLTSNECKRLMVFPKDFIFPVREERAYEQLGNSVAVPFLKAIAHQIVASGVFEKA